MKVWLVRAIAPDGRQWAGTYSTEAAARARVQAWKADGYQEIRMYAQDDLLGGDGAQ